MVKAKGPQMMSYYSTYTLHAGLAKLHAHAHVPGYPHAHTDK